MSILIEQHIQNKIWALIQVSNQKILSKIIENLAKNEHTGSMRYWRGKYPYLETKLVTVRYLRKPHQPPFLLTPL